MFKICIGLPVHNGAKTILESLESLSRQTYKDLRFFVFENASTDGTREIVEEFCKKDARFTCVPSEKFLPALENFARARRYMVNISEYHMLLAADDAVNDRYVEAAVKALDDVPGSALAVPKVAHKLSRDKFVYVNQDVLDLRSFGRFRRSFRQIGFPPSWYYGVYRGNIAEARIAEAIDLFPDVWGSDRMVVLMFLLRGEIVQSELSELFIIPNPRTRSVYGQKTASLMLRARKAYFRALWGKRHALPLGGRFGRMAYFFLCWKTSEAHTTYRWNRILGRFFKDPLT